MKIVVSIFCAMVLASTYGVGRQQSALVPYHQSHRAMGTTFEVKMFGENREQLAAAAAAAFEEVDRLDAQMSNYKETSELSYINRTAWKTPVIVEPEFFGLLKYSLDNSRAVSGAFDITVGPLMRTWGFFRGEGRLPSAREIKATLKTIGYKHVTLNNTKRTIAFDLPGVEIDLGGIAKGYAVDKMAEQLREAGIKSALINAGSSSLYAIGAPPGEAAWQVAVRDPLDSRQTIENVYIKDASLSTSGSYEKFFKIGEKIYCHIMDPRTGFPVEGMLSVTVIAPSGVETDLLSTTLFVLGVKKSKEFLKSRKDVRAIIYYRKAQEKNVLCERIN